MAPLASASWQADAPADAALHALADPDAPGPTVSIYLRTDPRDPANAAHSPGWLVAARNGLRAVADQLEDGDDRDARLRWRELRPAVEAELERLMPDERGRSLVWFLGFDGTPDARFVLQVALRDHVVELAHRPVIAPFVEALDHSRPIGVVLVSGERVRLVHWAHGIVDAAGEEVFDLDDEHWRPYRGPSSATPGRGGRGGATHVENVEARVEGH
ncbi:MAG TPA: hypothetical protein VNT55_07885, partial [Baekduia sp.]|nr:hypothetical protein [Baekduia sp.]